MRQVQLACTRYAGSDSAKHMYRVGSFKVFALLDETHVQCPYCSRWVTLRFSPQGRWTSLRWFALIKATAFAAIAGFMIKLGDIMIVLAIVALVGSVVNLGRAFFRDMMDVRGGDDHRLDD